MDVWVTTIVWLDESHIAETQVNDKALLAVAKLEWDEWEDKLGHKLTQVWLAEMPEEPNPHMKQVKTEDGNVAHLLIEITDWLSENQREQLQSQLIEEAITIEI